MKTTPILDPLLEPGEGGLMNICGDYALEIRRSEDKSEWMPLINYLNDPSNNLSKQAVKLGLYMIGYYIRDDVGNNIADVGDWYIEACENEKKNVKILFK